MRRGRPTEKTRRGVGRREETKRRRGLGGRGEEEK